MPDRAPPPTFVTPRINHQKNKNNEAQSEEDYRAPFIFPELTETFGDFLEIHAKANLHYLRKNKT